mmetsp:Transcript_21530/g.54251  ORF Transcript_21530/g.54251 Transcript_21530/m.54251 type:complete len:161 (-) Transcript_21530:559-1041(-)|eukprot:g2505.t1
MAINLDKAGELFRQSLQKPIPLHTAPTRIINHIDQLSEQGRVKVVNPALCHCSQVPFQDWDAWHTKNHDPEKIRFFIHSVNGRCVPIEASPQETVGELKEKIHASEEVPRHLIRLRTLRGKDLEKDKLTLEQCGYTHEVAKGDPNEVTLRMICRESVLWR